MATYEKAVDTNFPADITPSYRNDQTDSAEGIGRDTKIMRAQPQIFSAVVLHFKL
jgi:hypothetical protein